MNSEFYIYNNEAISVVVFAGLMKIVKSLDVARVFIVLPLLLDDRIVRKLSYSYNSMDDFFDDNAKLLVGFNERYLELLPITLNTINILNESKTIKILNDKIIYIENNKFDFNHDFGIRANKIVSVILNFSVLLGMQSTDLLYKNLKVQI
ncbi:MAG: DUF6521 family protein [Sulfuricurvum sp.]|nr:DUF6521 family protein [Sulfuricurvum sp.]